jgi:acetoin utilization protein AcuB
MLVSMWMTRALVTVTPATSIADAALTMSRARVRRLLVTEPSARGEVLRGIVSLHDLARAFPPDVNPLSLTATDCASTAAGRTIDGIMTTAVRSVAPETPLEEAARVLLEHKIGAVPVVRDGILAGIITESDIFKAFLEVTGAAVAGVRVTFDVAADEDPFAVVVEIAQRHRMRVVSVLSMSTEGKRLAVVRVTGPGAERFVDDIWKSGHRVVSVLHTAPQT